MSHTIKHQAKLLARVRRMKGQMEAIETALLAEKPCGEIMNLTASVRGALTGLMTELVEEHIHEHIVAENLDASERHHGADELIDVIRSYLK